MDTITHWIGGKPWAEDAARTVPVHDPATGAVTALVACAGRSEVDAAVSAAAAAQLEWGSASLSVRTRVLFAFRELVDRHREDLARLITAEHGKTLDDAFGEVTRGLEVAEFACGIPHLLKGGFNASVSSQVDTYELRQPIGVAVGISPFNFPVMVPMWMHPVAIACGNAFVLKASERDPSASQLVAELWSRAGLPDGVFSVVHGDREAVDALLEHPRVAAVSFVGSTPVARHVYETAGRHGKRVQSLGGAKNHMVVLPDADLDGAADAAVSAAYGSAGERCMAISVVVAVGESAEDLVARIAERARSLRVGPGDQPDVEMGPLITAAHRDRVAGLVEDGVTQGAELVVDGRAQQVPSREGGFWLGPCLFDHVQPHMTIYTEEIFGPVLCVVRAGTLDEALDVVNGNPYGNGSAIFTRDGAAARLFEQAVTTGMVGVNVPIPVPMAYHSFGGWKSSLFGDTRMHGEDGVRFYTQGKVVTRRWPTRASARPDLGFPRSQ